MPEGRRICLSPTALYSISLELFQIIEADIHRAFATLSAGL